MNRLLKIAVFSIVSFFCILLLQCTAYFNTYYNAEIAYKEANDAHKKKMRNYPDSIVVAPDEQVSKKYERAIEKSIKVIEVYTKKKKWHDDALFLMARSYFYKKDMAKAIRRFKELQQSFPSSPFVPESYLYLAKAYIEEDNLNKAEEIVESILQKYPHLDSDLQVSMLLVEISIRRQGNAQAILLLEKAFKSVKSEEQRIDLILRLSELYIELKQYPKAVTLLVNAPRKKDLQEQSYRMDRALVNCYIEMDSIQKALALIEIMDSKKMYENHRDEILFKKGVILTRMGKIDEAILVFTEITSKMDSTNVANDSCEFCAKALYELALLYQTKKSDLKNARQYYLLSSQSKDTSGRVVSRKRLTALQLMEKLRKGEDTLDGPWSSRQYKIAELFKYELDEPDSAFRLYLNLSKDSTVDSLTISKSISAAAIISRDQLNDTIRSDSLFKVLITRFPATDYAKNAQKQLGLPVTIKTRQDSAYDAFCKAEDLLYKNGDAKGAIQSFYNVYKKYPELDIAPKSLYTAAWLSDDLLEKNRTAKTLYEKICEKYPESDYCKNLAKVKVQTVLDTLKVLEAKRMISGKNKKESDKKNVVANDSLAGRGTVDNNIQQANQDSDSLNMDEPDVESKEVAEPPRDSIK